MSAYTTTASLTSVQTAYNREADFALRPLLHFDQVATVKPTRQAMPGNVVKFTIYADLAVASTALDESTDVNAVAMSDSQPSVTLVEYGNAVLTTAKLRGTSFLSVDTDAANVVGFNAGVSQDTIARDVLKAGSNVRYASGGATLPTARNTIEPGDTITGNDIRRARTDLRGASVMTYGDDLYVGFIHPDVAYDLRRDTSSGATWRDARTYTDNTNLLNGEVGVFEGVRFVETERAPVFADAGSSTTLTDVYATIIVGQQALAKAFSSAVSAENAQVVIGPVTDKLRRFHPLGWYWLGGYGRYREAAIRRIESSSSIGVNA